MFSFLLGVAFRPTKQLQYDNLQKYNLPYPEAVFDINFYRTNPKPFCLLAQEILFSSPGKGDGGGGGGPKPTVTHYFVSLLARKGLLLRNYTQNIDGLEYLAGIPTEKLVECHGNYRTASCIDCHYKVDDNDVQLLKAVRTSIVTHAEPLTCPECNVGLVKPDIVFFGEELPNRHHELLFQDIVKNGGQADLILVLGTSLKVAPVATIPERANKVTCKRVLINRELVGGFQDTCKRSRCKEEEEQLDIETAVRRRDFIPSRGL